MNHDQLRTQAQTILRHNDTGLFTKPGPRQWNWDSAFNVMGLLDFDPSCARQEIRALLR